MSAALMAVMAALGAVGGFLSGLLGFGGGVLMFPLLYYVPPLLGLGRFDAKTVAAIVISQVFFSALIGGLAHLRSGRIKGKLALNAGVVSAIGAFAGGVASKWASEQLLLLLFGIMTLCVSLILFLPGPATDDDRRSAETVSVPQLPLALCSLATGVFIGFLGAGNFVFVPLLIYIFKVPTRVAIGSTLFIALINTATGFLGKLITGQIPLIAVVVVLGAAIGALTGEKAHRLASTRLLRVIYATMVFLVTIRVWLTIMGIAA
jgi:uncharacterized membrane protein YfcA